MFGIEVERSQGVVVDEEFEGKYGSDRGLG
jgi:hypothetical protein